MDNEIQGSIIGDWTGKFNKQIWKILLFDRTTRKNIIWATSEYDSYGVGYEAKQEITLSAVSGIHGDIIQPRVMKSEELRQQRTRKRAEVFTPSWLCNKQNNFVDVEWFGRENVFNESVDSTWRATIEKVLFPEKNTRTWKKYVDSRRLELTCGEAPYLVSRYDTVTGAIIDVEQRIGILDRKLRIVNENAANEDEWLRWATRAFQSTYGYEFQGDNLLIARLNLILTFVENLHYRWKREAGYIDLQKIARIISWNVWQMDGLLGTVPYGTPEESLQQMSLFEDSMDEVDSIFIVRPQCKIMDWRWKDSLTYNSIKDHDYRGDSKMKFDVVIGNPPYQDETVGDQKNYAPPIYHTFLENSYKVAKVVEMIHPARFLFDAGSTPKQWNQKMLNDTHLKILEYNPISSFYFSNTDIKGGIAITYWDYKKEFGKIGHFIVYEELRSILRKVNTDKNSNFSNLIYAPESYKFTDKMHVDFPQIEEMLSKGHKYDFKTNVLTKLNDIVFFDNKPNSGDDYVQIVGLNRGKRSVKWIKRTYIKIPNNFTSYKIFIPEANGTGAIGEVLSTPLIGEPLIGHTQTFISVGKFNTAYEAESVLKYVKSKFCRVMLGTLKITQHNSRATWRNVPLQDFTPKSDIDWTKSIHEIDLQLYKKYGFDDNEISFIESKVKEMA